MKKFLPLIALLASLYSCQKEDSMMAPASTADLKEANASTYNKVKNAIVKRAEMESYCNSEYYYTDSIYINGVAWQYPTSGYEYLMYKGLTHFADGNNDYLFCGLEYPTEGFAYGIGLGKKVYSTGYYSFVADVKVCIPDKNYSITYASAPCFAMGDQNLTSTDSIRIVLHKVQKQDLKVTADSIISFAELKNKLGTAISGPDSVALYSDIGKISSYHTATIYNWDYYNGGTTEVYGLENAGKFTNNLNFGDGLIGSCSGTIDIYLHKDKVVYQCSTNYSIFYTDYIGARKQLHIYE
jgi:hypothetical protein